jgi:hypothetical protein
MVDQKRSSLSTPISNSCAWLARTAALIAPADVPQMIGKGLPVSATISLTAFNTPTW